MPPRTQPAILFLMLVLLSGIMASAAAQDAATDGAEEPAYMIGIQVADATDADRQRHGLRGDFGVVVRGVLEGGPADDAGIESGDLLLRLDNRPLDNVRELDEAVARSGGRALTLTLRRAGMERIVRLTPAPRSRLDLPEPPLEPTPLAKGIGELLRKFSPSDLLDLGGLELDIRRRGSSGPSGAGERSPGGNSPPDAITIYGRVNVGQLLGFWSGDRPSETTRLKRRLQQLEQQVEQLQDRLDALSGETSPSDAE